MADKPQYVKARFVNEEANEAGIYLMSIYVNGIKTPVVVDDYIPTMNGKPCFARSNEGELWVCLLEKAWAKLYGTYCRMEGGDPSFAAMHLNGSPAKSIWHQELSSYSTRADFYQTIKYADERGYTMMSGTNGQGEQRLAKGVISGHAYSLISIHEFEFEG
jgi:calpain-15